MDATKVNEALREICSFAAREVEFYRQLFQESSLAIDSIQSVADLSKIPLLTKQAVQQNMSSMFADPFQRYPQIDKITVQRSLGKQGYYSKTLWLEDEQKLALDSLTHQTAAFGKREEMRCCTFHTSCYEDNLIVEIKPKIQKNNRLSLSNQGLAAGSIKIAYEEIMCFAPNYCSLLPTVAYQLADYMQQHRLPPPDSLKYIELTGEHLSGEWREFLEKIFRVPIRNYYSLKEVGIIAYECNCGRMHLVEENTIVEVVKDGRAVIDEVGEIIVTSLQNHAMPFLRLQTGDQGVLHSSACACGSKTPSLKIAAGRTPGFILTKNKEKVNRYSLKGLIEYTNEYMSNSISRVELKKQEEPGIVMLQLTLKPAYYGWEDAIKQEFLKQVQNGDWPFLDWKITFTDREK